MASTPRPPRCGHSPTPRASIPEPDGHALPLSDHRGSCRTMPNVGSRRSEPGLSRSSERVLRRHARALLLRRVRVASALAAGLLPLGLFVDFADAAVQWRIVRIRLALAAAFLLVHLLSCSSRAVRYATPLSLAMTFLGAGGATWMGLQAEGLASLYYEQRTPGHPQLWPALPVACASDGERVRGRAGALRRAAPPPREDRRRLLHRDLPPGVQRRRRDHRQLPHLPLAAPRAAPAGWRCGVVPESCAGRTRKCSGSRTPGCSSTRT